jgi:hypothetical protein
MKGTFLNSSKEGSGSTSKKKTSIEQLPSPYRKKVLFDVAQSCTFQRFAKRASEEQYSTYLKSKEKGVSS